LKPIKKGFPCFARSRAKPFSIRKVKFPSFKISCNYFKSIIYDKAKVIK